MLRHLQSNRDPRTALKTSASYSRNTLERCWIVPRRTWPDQEEEAQYSETLGACLRARTWKSLQSSGWDISRERRDATPCLLKCALSSAPAPRIVILPASICNLEMKDRLTPNWIHLLEPNKYSPTKHHCQRCNDLLQGGGAFIFYKWNKIDF